MISERAADAVRLLADVVQRPRLPDTELARVKGNLLRNLAIQRSTPQSIAQEQFAELVYGEHPYGRLFPTEAMLKGYTIDQVKAFHKNNYSAGRARLYVAGVFDAAAVEAAVRKAFEGWDRGAPGRTRLQGSRCRRSSVCAARSRGRTTVDGPARTARAQPLAQGLGRAAGDRFAARRLVRLAHHGEHQGSRRATPTPLSVAVEAHPGQASWVETADVTTKVTGESLKEIFFEIERLRKEAPPADELRGIQNNLAGIFVVQNASRSGVIGRLAFVDLHGLGDDYLTGYVKRVMSVTPEDVRRIANEYFTPEKMTLVVVGDVKTVKEQLTPWSTR